MLITPDQIRAARALLRMDQEELARRAHVSVVTVRRVEGPGGLGAVSAGTVADIQHVLEAAGAEFIERGVQRRKRSSEEVDARVKAILTIAAESAARQAKLPPFNEDDLYDENGL